LAEAETMRLSVHSFLGILGGRLLWANVAGLLSEPQIDLFRGYVLNGSMPCLLCNFKLAIARASQFQHLWISQGVFGSED
jgi:hypothetical protein